MASAQAKKLAYKAGRAAAAEPGERRSVDACPFSSVESPEERIEWLRGLQEALDDDADNRANVRRALTLELNDHLLLGDGAQGEKR